MVEMLDVDAQLWLSVYWTLYREGAYHFWVKNVDSWLADAQRIHGNHFHICVDPVRSLQVSVITYMPPVSTYQNLRYMLLQHHGFAKI